LQLGAEFFVAAIADTDLSKQLMHWDLVQHSLGSDRLWGPFKVRETAGKQRHRLFTCHRYLNILNRGTELPKPSPK